MRHYLCVKKLVGQRGKTQNIPDGYLIDLSSPKRPVLYVVEVELETHHPIRHVAQQLLDFSLSFQSTPQKMKHVLREELLRNPEALTNCESYATTNGFHNIDYLLERLIFPEDAFNTLVVIDELDSELESILLNSLRFPVEVLTLQRFKAPTGSVIYQFEPFLHDLNLEPTDGTSSEKTTPALDPSEIDTIVVSAREEGFREVFLGENRWYKIRIHANMIPRIRYIAAYQVAPVSAITHVAEVADIQPWEKSNKYVMNFRGPASEIRPLKLVQGGSVKAPQAPRYTSFERIKSAETLDQAFA